MRNVRKIVFIALTCTLILSTSQAIASSLGSLVGKRVSTESEVYVDGVRISDAIIIEGKSYAPVRDIAESVGREVNFTSAKDGGKAVITIKYSDEDKAYLIASIDSQLESLGIERQNLQNDITLLNERREKELALMPDEASEVNKRIDGQIAEREKRINEINTEIERLEVERKALI